MIRFSTSKWHGSDYSTEEIVVGVGSTVEVGRYTYLGDGRGVYSATYFGEDGKFHDVSYAYTWDGGACPGSGEATLDASEQDIATYHNMLAAKEAERARRIRADRVMHEVTQVERGHEVVVVRGRKVKVGTRGVVVWTGMSDWGSRVGIKVGADVVFTATTNVERIADDVIAEFEAATA